MLNGKEISNDDLFKIAKKQDPAINGLGWAVEFLKNKGKKIKFFKTTTKRWVNA
jgi:hypothetical protein